MTPSEFRDRTIAAPYEAAIVLCYCIISFSCIFFYYLLNHDFFPVYKVKPRHSHCLHTQALQGVDGGRLRTVGR